ATRSTFGDVERDTRQRAPHLAREVRIVVRDLLEGGPKGADDVEDDVVDLEHAYLHRPVARGDAPHQARAGAVQAPSEARTARAARGCGLDGVEHAGRLVELERRKFSSLLMTLGSL